MQLMEPTYQALRRGSVNAGALAGLAAADDVRLTLGVADLRRRGVARAVEASVDRVRDELVPVRIQHVVVRERDRAVDGVADEALPEPVVPVDLHVPVDRIVLERVPGRC